MYGQAKTDNSGATFEDVIRFQESLHASERISTSFTVETHADAGQRVLLCLVTAVSSGPNNLPGAGCGTSITVGYHNLQAMPARVLEALEEMRDMLADVDDVPF